MVLESSSVIRMKKNEELKNARPRIRIFLHLHDVDAIDPDGIHLHV